MRTRHTYIHYVRSGSSIGTLALAYRIEGNQIRYSYAFCVEAQIQRMAPTPHLIDEARRSYPRLQRIDVFSRARARVITAGRLDSDSCSETVEIVEGTLPANQLRAMFEANQHPYRIYGSRELLLEGLNPFNTQIGFISTGNVKKAKKETETPVSTEATLTTLTSISNS